MFDNIKAFVVHSTLLPEGIKMLKIEKFLSTKKIFFVFSEKIRS